MKPWADEWVKIGLSCEPADFDCATAAALRAYAVLGLDKPMVVLRMSSPLGATIGGDIALSMLRKRGSKAAQTAWSKFVDQVWSQVGDQVRDQVWSQVGGQVRDKVGSQVGDQVWDQVGGQVRDKVWSQVVDQVWSKFVDQVWSQVGDQVRDQVWSQVGGQVRDQVWSQVGGQVWSQVGDQVWDQVGGQVRDQVRGAAKDGIANDYGGSFWAGWGAYVSYLRDVLGWNGSTLKLFEIEEDLIRSCGWVWWHNNVLAISDRPAHINRNARGQLHNESGPSIAYRDGWSLWHIDGLALDEQIIMRPETQTVEQIDAESNNDVRAIRLARFGIARYLTDTGATVLDECRNEIEGTHEALLKDNKGDVYLWPTCPSGRLCPPLRVPAEIEKCEQARTWLAGERPCRIVART